MVGVSFLCDVRRMGTDTLKCNYMHYVTGRALVIKGKPVQYTSGLWRLESMLSQCSMHHKIIVPIILVFIVSAFGV